MFVSLSGKNVLATASSTAEFRMQVHANIDSNWARLKVQTWMQRGPRAILRISMYTRIIRSSGGSKILKSFA